MPRIYYNDNDVMAAAWLRELIMAGHLPEGDVDNRSIKEIEADELRQYDQCHFFAGIGGWPLALKMASWPDDASVWTGSCPCQPFSAAGKRKGTADDRHLWPDFARLIGECRPPVVFGEQVASKAGREWLSVVRDDLETMGYAVGAADLCAASVGAPHIRQRLWWVADCVSEGLEGWPVESTRQERQAVERSSDAGGMGNSGSSGAGRDSRAVPGSEADSERQRELDGCVSYSVVDASADGWLVHPGNRRQAEQEQRPGLGRPSDAGGVEHAARDGREQGRAESNRRVASVRCGENAWGIVDLLHCTDQKYRPVEPGTFPLAHGIPGRVAQLRGLGNAIVPQVAAEFIRAYRDCVGAATSGVTAD